MHMKIVQHFICASLIILPTLFFSHDCYAQEEGDDDKFVQFDAGADFVSRYVWRGTSEGDAPYIHPWFEMTMGRSNHKFNLLVDVAQPFSKDDPFQFDLEASYTYKDALTITLTDYFLPDDPVPGAGYFNYNENTGNHLLEVSATWEGSEKFPASFMAAYNIYGSDPERSIYLEAGYDIEPFTLFLGMTPRTGMYHEEGGFGFSVVNVGFTYDRLIPVGTKFNLPVFTTLVVNPQAKRAFLIFGISL